MLLQEIKTSENLNKAHMQFLIRIFKKLDSRQDIEESIDSFMLIYKYLRIEKVYEFIEKVKHLMIIKEKYRICLVNSWATIIAHFKNYEMMDTFVDYYYFLNNDKVFVKEIIKLYSIFTNYFLKYLKEFENIKDLNEISNHLITVYETTKNNLQNL